MKLKQIGDYNTTLMMQSGEQQVMNLHQLSDRNTANLDQSGEGNLMEATQKGGNLNFASLTQTGVGHDLLLGVVLVVALVVVVDIGVGVTVTGDIAVEAPLLSQVSVEQVC